jgi:hypothetical protein
MSIKAVIASQFDATGVLKAQKAFGGLSKSIRGTVGALGLTVGLAATANAIKQATKAAAEDAKSQALLATQLRNTLGANDALIGSVEESIRQMQLSAAVADDVLRPAFAQLVRATGDVGNATKLTQLALDVSAGTGRDLNSVAIALSKAYQGNTTALSRLGIKAEKGVDVFAQLEEQFGGTAEAAARNDPFQRLSVIIGELQEQIGFAFLPLLNRIGDYFATAEFGKAFSDMAIAIKIAVEQIDILARRVFGQSAFTVLLNIISATAVGAAQLAFVLTDIADTVFKIVTGNWAGAGKNMTTFFDRYNKFVADIYKEQDKAAKNIGKNTVISTVTGGVTGSAGSKTVSAVKKVSEAAKALAEKASAAAEALKKQNEALAEFKTELAGLTIQPLVDAGREIGQFEQNAMDSFNAIRDTIQQGLLDKTIGAKGAANLLAYVNAESAAFEKLARQRDELAAKRSLAESIFRDTKSAIVGLANLNSFLERQTETVTETVTRIVSGVKIATTRTIEELKSNGNIVSGFKAVLSKTKEFAQQLKTLRELGLDRNLYSQIVQSGVEAGSQTAAAIIEGGAGTVSELNSLFADLNNVGNEIANQTAEIMYDAGETITSSLIAGLKAQEEALIAQAKKMAEVFNQSFTSQVQALPTPTVESTGKETLSFTLADIKKMTGELGTGAIAQQNAKLAAQLINRPEYTAYGTVVNISVKADATTNGKALGAAIQAELNKYAKASK